MTNPTPSEITKARKEAGLTQIEAAKLLDVTRNGFQKWEQGERKMPKASWRLFLILTQQKAIKE